GVVTSSGTWRRVLRSRCLAPSEQHLCRARRLGGVGYGGWGRGRGRRSRGGSATPLPFIPPRGICGGPWCRRLECSMTQDSQQVPALELFDPEGCGTTCASCAARVEKKLTRLEGFSASVNSATEKASIQVPPGVSAEELIAVVEKT